jgi:hypothetical protein
MRFPKTLAMQFFLGVIATSTALLQSFDAIYPSQYIFKTFQVGSHSPTSERISIAQQ